MLIPDRDAARPGETGRLDPPAGCRNLCTAPRAHGASEAQSPSEPRLPTHAAPVSQSKHPLNSPPSRPGGPTIGILGGIASGKSAAARQLAGPKGVVIDADHHARAALNSPEVVQELVAAFGEGILGPDGAPDRPAIAARVFADPDAKRRLESWIHPAVRARMRAELDDARVTGRRPIVLDVPLLLENDAHHGLVQECDFLVYVDSDPAARDARAVENRGWKPGEVARREDTQLPQSAKRARARYVIDNRGELSELESAVEAILTAEGLRE